MNANHQQLKPVYDFDSNETSILLHKNLIKFCINQHTYTSEGEVRLELLPRAGIYLYGSFQNVVPADQPLEHREGEASFFINDRPVKGFPIRHRWNIASPQLHIKWCPETEPLVGVGDKSTQITRMVFHLFNFVEFRGTRISSEKTETKTETTSTETEHGINHVDLCGSDWKIELKSLTSTRNNFKHLKEEGGYRLTHIGDIQKQNGGSFSGQEAEECLEAVRFFLSFAKGCWCIPVCAAGFDASGKRVWESWSSPREAWYNPLSWFAPHHGSQLSTAFPGFMGRWKNDDWRKTLCEVLYWYLNANSPPRGLEAGIILTQAAIERLSYEFTVKDRCLVSVDRFKKHRASDKFRLLFSSLKIPLDIPAEASELQNSAHGWKKEKWLDAPHALTEIRNSLVHPEHKRSDWSSSTSYEAWNLGLWYLEMGILSICGYKGTYGDRRKQRTIGQVKTVPWK